MTTIKAVVRQGRLEVDRPIDLPDGTELVIPVPSNGVPLGIRDEDWSNTPEAIEDWIRWYESLEPMEFTAQERAAWEAARREDKENELSQWDKRSEQIEGHFS